MSDERGFHDWETSGTGPYPGREQRRPDPRQQPGQRQPGQQQAGQQQPGGQWAGQQQSYGFGSEAASGGPSAGGGAEPPLPPELNPRGRSGGSVPRPAGPDGRPLAPRPMPAPGPGGPGGPVGPSGPGGPGGPGGAPVRRRWSRKRKIRFTIFVLVLAVLGTTLGTYFWADSKLNHADVLQDYAGRPDQGSGTNWLIVGSDSRQGLTKAEQQKLHTGYDTGARTDSMMILHTGSHGDTLMSIPRDSYVTIPAWTDSKGVKHAASQNKINAAYAYGDGPLLVKTIEYNTGLRIDHYAEIGFAGFVDVVNDLGGVHMCLDHAIKDQASGADLKAGCQTLNGQQSLAFVRERHQEATQDLARMQHQQQFLAALSHKAASFGTLANPFRLYPTLGSGLDMLTVDNGTGLTDLARMFFAMKAVKGKNGHTITVPIANANYSTPAGDAVLWNMTEAKQIFTAFRNDTTVPSFSN